MTPCKVQTAGRRPRRGLHARWLVEAMLDLVKDETERIDSRFLEPAAGPATSLCRSCVASSPPSSSSSARCEFERRHYALLGLMCIYGIELLDDNMAECRANLLEIFAEYLSRRRDGRPLPRGGATCSSQNIVHGDALAMRRSDGEPITFAEWGYLGKASSSAATSATTRSCRCRPSGEDTLFADLGKHEIFTPVRSYPPMTIDGVGRRDDHRRDRPGSRCGAATPTC